MLGRASPYSVLAILTLLSSCSNYGCRALVNLGRGFYGVSGPARPDGLPFRPELLYLGGMTDPQPKRRRWYQFSLRTLMLFVFVCAIPSAWVGWDLEATRREQVAVAKIKELWGTVQYHETIGPDWLARHFRKVNEIDQVRTLFGGQPPPPPITNDDLKDLRKLTRIEGLWLDYMRINDTGLEYLKELKNLKCLDLSGTQITDAGLIHLKRLTNLERLYLQGTQITDAGLVHLEGLTNLERLGVQDTQVTDAGVEKLQRALPNCKILH